MTARSLMQNLAFVIAAKAAIQPARSAQSMAKSGSRLRGNDDGGSGRSHDPPGVEGVSQFSPNFFYISKLSPNLNLAESGDIRGLLANKFGKRILEQWLDAKRHRQSP
jgi:hypothetical protein